MEQKLIARDRECSMLRDCIESDRSEFVIVYGRRRVGKTFLIDQYFKMNYDFSFVGSHRSTQRVQLRNFGKAMKQYAGLKTVPKYADSGSRDGSLIHSLWIDRRRNQNQRITGRFFDPLCGLTEEEIKIIEES